MEAVDLGARHQKYREMGWWPGQPLQDRYAHLVKEQADGLAVVDSRGRRLSHRQLIRASDDFEAFLSRCGVCAGDVVLIQLPNWVEWQVVFLAVLRMGAIPASIPLRTDAPNLLSVCELTGVRALVTAEGAGTSELHQNAAEVVAQCGHALELILVSTDGRLRHAPGGRGGIPAQPDVPGLDHIMFTSSTTGRPKAVMHSADTLAALNLGFSRRFGLTRNTPIFMASPLGHSVGAIHGARLALHNASLLVLQEQWDPAVALAMVEDFGCAFTAAATPFLKDLVETPQNRTSGKLASMRWFLCGGAPVPPELMDRTRDEFPGTRVTVLWGMTEGGLTTCVADSPWEKFRSTCGIGLPGLEIQIRDYEDNRLSPGNEGELIMRGPGVFYGYLRQDDLYASLLTHDGFFRTGDLATVDPEGYVRITGRLKDLIIRGGVNISPIPIEDALSAHPSVSSVAVIGVPDDRLGERILAVIEPKDRRPDLEELVSFARSRGLPKYHCPEALRYVDTMPRTPAGKIRKMELRGLLAPVPSMAHAGEKQ